MIKKNNSALKAHAKQIFMAGVHAAVPKAAIQKSLRLDQTSLVAGQTCYNLEKTDQIFVVGAGKATAVMAQTIEEILGPKITDGLICVKYGHTAPLNHIRTIEAAHPVPDANGCEASEQILKMVHRAGKNDLVICLLSGGGSALLPLPAKGLTLSDKQKVTTFLLECGADIHQINTVRKHLSGIKGGQLAKAAFPAKVLCLALSDVVGDDPGVIASGPCTADRTTFKETWKIITGYGLEDKIPEPVTRFIQDGITGKIPETPKPVDAGFENVTTRIVGSNQKALSACAKKAQELGYQPLILSAFIEGNTHTMAGVHAAIARQVVNHHQPIKPAACILSGGESTLVVKGNGKGGRNQEAALAVVKDIHDLENVVLLFAGTDGTDGPTDAAGAIADTSSLQRAAELGLDASDFLARNDAYSFFKKLDDLVITGPTGTNVMDLNILLVGNP